MSQFPIKDALNSAAPSDLTEAKLAAQAEGESSKLHRRDFLAVLSSSFAALSLSGCDFRAPEEKIIPLFTGPEGRVPGIAEWYASTCGGCEAACGVLVKNREGRPIKLEGNPDHPLSQGGLCARGQATVLDLYDSQRANEPTVRGEKTNWATLDAEINGELAAIRERGGRIRLLTSSIQSPSARRAIRQFLDAHPGARHIVHDSISYSALLDAHGLTHGVRRIPSYRFERASLIVGLNADFLGTWLSPVEFTRSWSEGRDVNREGGMARHVQFEAMMTTTGANADVRIGLKPSEERAVVFILAKLVAERLGAEIPDTWKKVSPSAGVSLARLEQVADELAAQKGTSLVVCGTNDAETQIAINAINEWLGNYGTTLDLRTHDRRFWGDDSGFENVLDEMERGEVDALINWRSNPAHTHPKGERFAAGLGKVGLSISMGERRDETCDAAQYFCPEPHALETWGDANPRVGVYSINQPTIAPLYDSRPGIESLLKWSGEESTAYEYVRDTWREEIYPQSGSESFKEFWRQSVHDGIVSTDENVAAARFQSGSLTYVPSSTDTGSPDGLEFVAYPSVSLGDGRQANNPWLQELPDPISKTTWGNFAAMARETAEGLKVRDGQIVEIGGDEYTTKLPILVQRGMVPGVVAVALGYGRPGAGKIAANYPVQRMFAIEQELLSGANVYPLLIERSVRVKATDQFDPLAKSQEYDTQTEPFTHVDRDHAKTIELKNLSEGLGGSHGAGHEGGHATLWAEHEYPGHKWGMTIDLNKCTGCSACVVGCQAENNIPVVGKVEVRKNREMHWLRLDRYYDESDENGDEASEESQGVSFQPMLCQHCDHAPCETVCPVLATVHSEEGLNQQVYNRCVGTRYCANNCPYKVRRFNWFDYAHDDLLQNLVLNPDVTVRSRGVMEKCTFCIQRINETKRDAKLEGRHIRDGDLQPACMQSCPSRAITFGDTNDPKSEVTKSSEDARAYAVLDELGVKPAIRYLARARNGGPEA